VTANIKTASDEILHIHDDERLRILTLNRPERMNALSPELHHLLRDAILAAATDPSVGAVMLTGAGKAFCSGGDVKASSEVAKKAKERESIEQRADSLVKHGESTLLLSQMPKPTIAFINGAAVGAGLSLALACDIRIGAKNAILKTGYADIGLAGDLGISYFLNRLVGAARARELMLLNKKIDMDLAKEIGLVSFSFEEEEAANEAMAIARGLASGPSVAYRYMKQNLIRAETAGLQQCIEFEAYNSARCVRTEDVKEAAAAFREKRAPKFTGR